MKYDTVLGIDIAKNVFQVCKTDIHGNVMENKRLSRGALIKYVSNNEAALIGIEACGSANYFARKFIQLGHDVKIMPTKYVKAYSISQKNDSNDARAIAEAVVRPKANFVPVKTVEQQDLQNIHRIRARLVSQRTALANQIRGFLAEYGVVINKGLRQLRSNLPDILEEARNELTTYTRDTMLDLLEELRYFDNRINQYDEAINAIVKRNAVCKRLLQIEGVGPLSAAALYITLGNGSHFKNGRHFAAYLGLVPRQKSSGNKVILSSITKQGNRYIRYLLINGARAFISYSNKNTDARSKAAANKKLRMHTNKVAVAVANQNARIAWAIVSKNEEYDQARLKGSSSMVANRSHKAAQAPSDISSMQRGLTASSMGVL